MGPAVIPLGNVCWVTAMKTIERKLVNGGRIILLKLIYKEIQMYIKSNRITDVESVVNCQAL